jgi:hypothetical protein
MRHGRDTIGISNESSTLSARTRNDSCFPRNLDLMNKGLTQVLYNCGVRGVAYAKTSKWTHDKEDHGKVASTHVEGCDHHHSANESR